MGWNPVDEVEGRLDKLIRNSKYWLKVITRIPYSG